MPPKLTHHPMRSDMEFDSNGSRALRRTQRLPVTTFFAANQGRTASRRSIPASRSIKLSFPLQPALTIRLSQAAPTSTRRRLLAIVGCAALCQTRRRRPYPEMGSVLSRSFRIRHYLLCFSTNLSSLRSVETRGSDNSAPPLRKTSGPIWIE
jgi:hypothetical protein